MVMCLSDNMVMCLSDINIMMHKSILEIIHNINNIIKSTQSVRKKCPDILLGISLLIVIISLPTQPNRL